MDERDADLALVGVEALAARLLVAGAVFALALPPLHVLAVQRLTLPVAQYSTLTSAIHKVGPKR